MSPSSFARRVLPAFVLALAAGCSLQPLYERPPAPVAGAFSSGAAYKSAQARETTLPAADIGWRDFLRDARLQRVPGDAPAHQSEPPVGPVEVAPGRPAQPDPRAG